MIFLTSIRVMILIFEYIITLSYKSMSQEEKMDQENVVSTLKEEPNFLAVQYN